MPKGLERTLYTLKISLALLTLFLGIISTILIIADGIESSNSAAAKISYLENNNYEQLNSDIVKTLLKKLHDKPQSGLTPSGTFWFAIEIESGSDPYPPIIEIRQLRGDNISFWELSQGKEKGSEFTPRALSYTLNQSGIILRNISHDSSKIQIIGKIDSESIVKPQIIVKSQETYDDYSLRDNKFGGLLFGGVGGLSIFSAVIAIINRDKAFLYLSALLLTTLRVSGFNYGWDLQWIGWNISKDYVPIVKNITLQLHIFLSLALFEELFKAQLDSRGKKIIFRLFYLSYTLLFALSLILSPRLMIEIIWVSGVATILIVFIFLAKVLRKSWSLVSFWYSLSWVISGLGMTGEILNAIGFSNILTTAINSQTAAISSVLLVGVALSTKLQLERYERINAQNSAILALRRFRQNYNTTPIGIFSVKFDGHVIEHNPAFLRMFTERGRQASLIGLNCDNIFNTNLIQSINNQLTNETLLDTEIRIPPNGEKQRWFHIRAFRKIDRHEIWIEDISPRKEAESQLKFLVNHDPLTGILNRRGVEPALERATELAGERVTSLAYVDLDRFKLVNDLFGHATGDQILRQMASRLRTVVAPPHIAARVGGDEFILIIDSLPLEEARSLCERLRAVLSNQPYQYQDKAFTVSASIGVVRILPGMTPGDALTASDRACSEAKRKGGRSVVCFDSDSSELSDYLEEIRIVAQIKERLPIENFFLVYQPIISLRHPDAGLSYEALIRMRDANGVVQSPARFIPAAERNGLMTQIDRWVLRDMLEWLDENPSHLDKLEFCTLNLSGASLNDEKFLQDTIALIRDHRRASRKICFEITESIALYDLNTTRRFVDSVKFLGAKVALDDFGAGYTSFSYLKELPADFVKIDGNFILNINSNTANYAIARAIVELTRTLGMACIAEWAENDDIIRSLIELDVDYAQGFGLCGPLEREKILTSRNGITLINNRTTTRLVLNAAISQSRKGRRKTLPH